jgi:DNA replication and repair protein RecF
MHLKSLTLINYKNFESNTFQFDAKINCIVGANGIGKTNVLDGIYHLSNGKSYFNPITSQNINHHANFFVLEGEYFKNERPEKVIISAKKGQKKIIKRNGKNYDKFSEHVGFLPAVIISPADRDLITEGSETRRKFIDNVISQSNKAYLKNLIDYNKILAQRNSLLKYFALNNTFDQETLVIYNEQLTQLGHHIFEQRRQFLAIFTPIFKMHYSSISKQHELVDIQYKSSLFDDDLINLLSQNLAKDRVMQYTTVGTHKDDLVFTLSNYSIKKFGSQGQQKSFLIALKLAQFDFLKKESNSSPILLLDDIFDKLDETRVEQIISLVDDDNFGQIFISDTHPTRTENVVKKIHQSYEIFKL